MVLVVSVKTLELTDAQKDMSFIQASWEVMFSNALRSCEAKFVRFRSHREHSFSHTQEIGHHMP